MGSSVPRESDGCEGASSHSQRTDVLFFLPAQSFTRTFMSPIERFCFVLVVLCAIRNDDKEWWIIRQGNLGAHTQAKPYTVHIGHGVNRSANHLHFISQISSDPIEWDCLRKKNFGNKDLGISKKVLLNNTQDLY